MPSTEVGRAAAGVFAASPVQQIRRRSGWLPVAVIVGHVVLISAQVNTRSGTSVLASVTFAAFSYVQRGAADAFGGVASVWRRYVALRGVGQENERLRRQVADLEVRLQQEHARALRAGRLELLLAFQQAVPVKTLAARVIAGDPTSFFRTVAIGRGSRDGVRADMAVISARGVVGRVVGEPAPHASRVQLLIDRSAGAGALVRRTRAGGVVVGDDGRTSLRMEYVSGLADVAVGDVVVTSGLDGIYHEGFVIGEVARVERGSGGARTIRIEPAVDFSSLEEVLVVLEAPPRAPTGEGGA